MKQQQTEHKWDWDGHLKSKQWKSVKISKIQKRRLVANIVNKIEHFCNMLVRKTTNISVGLRMRLGTICTTQCKKLEITISVRVGTCVRCQYSLVLMTICICSILTSTLRVSRIATKRLKSLWTEYQPKRKNTNPNRRWNCRKSRMLYVCSIWLKINSISWLLTRLCAGWAIWRHYLTILAYSCIRNLH